MRKLLTYLFGEEIVSGVSNKSIKESLIGGVLVAIAWVALYELLARWYG